VIEKITGDSEQAPRRRCNKN